MANDLTQFQDLQGELVRAGFDTTLKARREGTEAVFSLTIALHHGQTPETMAAVTGMIERFGLGFTAEGENVSVVALETEQAR
jgi:hypothetical protein